jgi:hypothetical protein
MKAAGDRPWPEVGGSGTRGRGAHPLPRSQSEAIYLSESSAHLHAQVQRRLVVEEVHEPPSLSRLSISSTSRFNDVAIVSFKITSRRGTAWRCADLLQGRPQVPRDPLTVNGFDRRHDRVVARRVPLPIDCARPKPRSRVLDGRAPNDPNNRAVEASSPHLSSPHARSMERPRDPLRTARRLRGLLVHVLAPQEIGARGGKR